MTSPFLKPLQFSAKLPSHILFNVKASNDHGFQLPASIFAESGKAYANDPVFIGDLSDEVRITVLRPFIENEDWSVRRSGLSNRRHQETSRRLS